MSKKFGGGSRIRAQPPHAQQPQHSAALSTQHRHFCGRSCASSKHAYSRIAASQCRTIIGRANPGLNPPKSLHRARSSTPTLIAQSHQCQASPRSSPSAPSRYESAQTAPPSLTRPALHFCAESDRCAPCRPTASG